MVKNYADKLTDIIVNDMLDSFNRADIAEKIKFGFAGVIDLGRAELEYMVWERFSERKDFDFQEIYEINSGNKKFCEWVKKNWRPVII